MMAPRTRCPPLTMVGSVPKAEQGRKPSGWVLMSGCGLETKANGPGGGTLGSSTW